MELAKCYLSRGQEIFEVFWRCYKEYLFTKYILSYTLVISCRLHESAYNLIQNIDQLGGL